jgi:hypothetical protein
MKGGRKLSSWNLFVKKVYSQGKSSDKNYSFKQALTDASRRKSEMGNSEPVAMGTKSRKHRSKKNKYSMKKTKRRHH